MLRIIFFTLISIHALSIPAQQVLSNAGNHLTNQQVGIAFTLGEAVVETVASSSTIATQGFHQPIDVSPVTAINSDPDKDPIDLDGSEIVVFPNPFQEELHIQIGEDQLQYSFFLHDEIGRNLNSGSLVNGETTIDLSNLASGNYMISVMNELGRRIRSFRIVKH